MYFCQYSSQSDACKEWAKDLDLMYKAFLAKEKENDIIFKAHLKKRQESTKFPEQI